MVRTFFGECKNIVELEIIEKKSVKIWLVKLKTWLLKVKQVANIQEKIKTSPGTIATIVKNKVAEKINIWVSSQGKRLKTS